MAQDITVQIIASYDGLRAGAALEGEDNFPFDDFDDNAVWLNIVIDKLPNPPNGETLIIRVDAAASTVNILRYA